MCPCYYFIIDNYVYIYIYIAPHGGNRSSCNETSRSTEIELNTQKFINRNNITNFELLTPNTCTNTSNVTITIIDNVEGTPRNSPLLPNFTTQIPSHEVLSTASTTSFIKLEGGENCSSRGNYYTFNGMPLVKNVDTGFHTEVLRNFLTP